jgi:hypothetical protein
MIKWLWDLMFTRSEWTIIEKINLYDGKKEPTSMPMGIRYILQNQWGNIKRKDYY